ncbi:MAG TPA: imidazolonepropionase [Phycisphaerae bacterium]|nr:imidazolonepropionase [Phycisphaerae bacterium]
MPDLLLITDIRTLAAVPPGPLADAAMREWPLIEDAALLVRDGRIAWFGPQREAPATHEGERVSDARRLSAAGGCVIPGLIDCHTHIPFAGNRSGEFVRRLAGETYLSIMQSGGGIRVTTAAVRQASRQQLVDENLPRLRRMLSYGVTTVECKSGYGLSPEHEIKQLAAVRDLAALQPIELVPTYLGAHALPAEFEGRSDEYIELMSSPELLARIAREKLARFCDVFCDRGAFTVEQARTMLSRAAAAGLRPKLHADELAQIGASGLAGELQAASADHLERIDDAGITALKSGGTVAAVLPGTSFFLGIEHCPARRLIEAGLPVAIATDFNPGSCMIESLPLVMNIAACQMRLRPTEIVAACTANAAMAVGAAERLGAIAAGYEADLVVLDAPTLDEWFYAVGRPQVRQVLKRGRAVYSATGEEAR